MIKFIRTIITICKFIGFLTNKFINKFGDFASNIGLWLERHTVPAILIAIAALIISFCIQ